MKDYCSALAVIAAFHLLVAGCYWEREISLSDYLYPIRPRVDWSDWWLESIFLYPAISLLLLRWVSPWNSIFGPSHPDTESITAMPIDEAEVFVAQNPERVIPLEHEVDDRSESNEK